MHRAQNEVKSPRLTAEVEEREKPAHEIRMGRVKAAIWRNVSGEEEVVRYNVAFSRLYHDGKRWHDSTSFGRDDLPLVMKVADLAHTWIYQQSGSAEG